MTERTLRAGIYARISEDKDGQQTATARQMDDAREFAARKGWDVVDVFEDVDISAFSARVRRPEFERMLEALRAGELDGIIVWKLDRLTRQQRDLARVIEACEPHKAFVASVTEPIDTRETYGQFVAELLVAQARMESANTSVRQRRKAQQQRELGLPPTSRSVVEEVVRAGAGNPSAVDETSADLIFVWSGSPMAFEHPRLGLFGPVPYRRPGGHTGGPGFAYIAGEGIAPGEGGSCSAFDVIATVITMLGQPVPERICGKSLTGAAGQRLQLSRAMTTEA